MSGRPINQSRMIAVLNGDRTYTGTPHDKCGTTERYVKGGGCVYCARIIATEQRDARKFLASVNQSPDNELDDSAEARYQAEIESLM